MLYKVVWRGERANGVILFNELKPRVIGRVRILIDNNGYNGVRFWSLFVYLFLINQIICQPTERQEWSRPETTELN